MSTTDRLRLGFIGCGSHSSRTLQPNARLVEQIELVGMCDLDAARAEAAAARWGTTAFTDVEEMLGKASPDAVVVVGPPTMMQPLTKEMLGRGLHVLTEKPPASSAELALELVEASKEAGVFGMVATHWRHSPVNARAREIIQGDGFGESSHCHGWFYAPGPNAPMSTWGAETGLQAFLLGQGVHLVDCTRSLMGDIESVTAEAKGSDDRFDSCAVSLRFASGASGTLSLVAHAPYWIGHRVFGNEGGVVEVENNRSLRTATPPLWTGGDRHNYDDLSFKTWENTQNMPGHTGGGYLQELTHFAESILAGRQPVASLEDGYKAMKVLEALAESARTGKKEKVG